MPRNNADSDIDASDRINQKFTFFGMVGVVMAAFKLKERWDGCRS